MFACPWGRSSLEGVHLGNKNTMSCLSTNMDIRGARGHISGMLTLFACLLLLFLLLLLARSLCAWLLFFARSDAWRVAPRERAVAVGAIPCEVLRRRHVRLVEHNEVKRALRHSAPSLRRPHAASAPVTALSQRQPAAAKWGRAAGHKLGGTQLLAATRNGAPPLESKS